MKKLVLVLILAICMGGMTFALDFLSYPDCIQPGSIMISPGFKLGNFYGLKMALGITVAGDYALPISFPLTVGLETGFVKVTNIPLIAIPILVRAQYHPDLGISKLDVYATLKLGWSIGMFTDDYHNSNKAGGGFSFGTNVGAKYFFTDFLGAFLELGYDYYAMRYKWSGGGLSGTHTWYIYTFLTTGVTLKF